MNQPWKVIFAFVGVFIAGAVFGGFFTARSTTGGSAVAGTPGPNARKEPGAPRPQSIAPAMLQNLTQRLKLTEEQREKIQPLVGRAEADLLRLRRVNFQDTTRVMERLHADITGWLTPEQKDDLEKMGRKMRENMRKGENNEKKRSDRGGSQTQVTPGAPVEATAGGPKGN